MGVQIESGVHHKIERLVKHIIKDILSPDFRILPCTAVLANLPDVGIVEGLFRPLIGADMQIFRQAFLILPQFVQQDVLGLRLHLQA